ncbi:MAG: M48 family metalloprotease [candidate division Zixibacteria bacterium]|nr:M48 family metalloprotease [candidate division Zixibacteria bacterium]
MNRSLRSILPIFICAVILLSCATTGPGGKKSFIFISNAQEVSIGRELDQQVRSTEKILDDLQWQAYITELGDRIVAVSDRKDIQYHFTVVESDQINAFAAPGGYVFVYTGLIKKMDNESELVSVMAHEISHIVARHGVKRLQSVLGLSLVLKLALGDKSDQTQQVAGAALGIMMSGYSRSNEHEADEFGLIYMTQAGWHPDGMIGMFEKLHAMEGDHQASMFEMLASSHPQTSDRIESTHQRVINLRIKTAGLSKDSNRFQQLLGRLR